MNLVGGALRRPYTVVVILVGVILGAWMALQKMPRDIFPPLGIPTIYVAQPFGGMDPAQMEGYLTYYYEYHFLYITGIEHVESKSIQGAALIKLQFHPGTDMAQAMAETVNYANRARAFMPPGTVPPFIMRFDAGSVAVGNLVFSTTNANRTVAQMQDAALNQVRPLFATLPGVSAPPPFGGSARSIVVNLKSDRLKAYHLTADEVVAALAGANVVSPSGNMVLGDTYPMVPVNSVVRNIKDLESVPIRPGALPAVFLRDVGDVSDAADLVTSYALINGRRTVYIPVTKRADASTLSVVGLVKKNLPKFQSVVPDDVRVSYEFDQAPFVTGAIDTLAREGALGAILTGLMVLLFLRDWRSALIVVINIPLSLLAGIFALWATGQSINLMTLGGLALAVGILVDEATVTIENVHAHLARGQRLRAAVLAATTETALPRFLAMLCVLSVFIPAFFLTGAGKALFVPLSMAVGFSMVASFLLSSTLVPILSAWFLRDHPPKARAASRWQTGYTRLASQAVAWRWLVLLLYLGLTVSAAVLARSHLGREIFPRVNFGQIQLRLRAPSGTRVEKTEALALDVLKAIGEEVGTNNVAITLAFVGVHAPSYPVNLVHLWNGGPEEGLVQVQLMRGAKIEVAAAQEHLRAVFAQRFPGVSFSFEPGDIVNRVMGFGSSTPVEIAVSGPVLSANREHAEKILDKLKGISSLRDVQFGQSLDYPTVDVTLNRERAGLMGVRVADAVRSLVPATSSSRFTVPNYWADPNSGVSYQIQVQVPQTNMTSMESVKNIPVSGPGGQSVLLRNLAQVSAGTAVGQYERYNMQRMITVTANIAGEDLGSVARKISSAIASVGPPPARVSVALRGQVVPMQQLLDGLRDGLGIAVVVIFLLLLANFQSIRLSLVVIATVPAVVAGVAVMLRLTGTTLNMQSFMGAIMAVGVAVANAILLVTFAEQHRRVGGDSIAAAIEGASSRLRPIIMTSVAMIAGMIPMALGLGEGGAQSAPLARSVIGGLLAATLSTLIVLPAIFALLLWKAPIKSAALDAEETERPK